MDIFGEIVLSSAVFLLLSLLLFLPVERLLPARHRREAAPLSDWVHFFVNPTLGAWAAVTLIAFAGGAIRTLLPDSVTGGIAALPIWVQLVITVALAELWAYWAHRLSHQIPFLWRFHRVHHSIEEMTWISAHRQHPFDAIWIMAGANLPAYALGVNLKPLALFIAFERMYTVLLHSNLDFSYGPLGRLFASTRFHHWHHDAGEEGRNRNYAGMFSCLDWLFGTYHESDRPPQKFGLGEAAPRGYWAQIFRR